MSTTQDILTPADLEQVTIVVPVGLYAQAKAARWWVEEGLRAEENLLYSRAEAIWRELVKPFGLLYRLEATAAQVEECVTGRPASVS
ncbi:MAG: hypothetical protein N2383_03310 [Caldilineales bacterium]|nr:hypothetical protein [Caldilineales bacterium]